MNTPTKYANRVITQSVYNSLHIGLQRMGKLWGWKIIEDNEEIEEGTKPITREELGLTSNEEVEKTGNELLREDVQTEPVPTLEEYIAAGYKAGNYEQFINRKQGGE